MYDKSQLMRGTLEGCILQIIQRGPTYGYEIATTLAEYGFAEVSEGTIYPLLLRLEKKGCILAEFRDSSLGPKRKYYLLTQEGRSLLEEFITVWHEHRESVERVLGGGGVSREK